MYRFVGKIILNYGSKSRYMEAMVLSQHLHIRTEENQNCSQYCRSQGRLLNPGYTEYKSAV